MSLNVKVPYISCINLNGMPILPPLITPELRKEVIKYKHQAIKLEQRLKNCRELKQNLDALLNAQTVDSRSCSQLSFGNDSHTEPLELSNNQEVKECFKKINLSQDIIDVSQYSHDGIKIMCGDELEISNYKKCLTTNENCDRHNIKKLSSKVEGMSSEGALDRDILIEQSSEICSNRELVFDGVNTQASSETQAATPKPRLIRSNSYTLDTPSPILLAHLQKNSRHFDIGGLTSARNWSSLENNHTLCDSSDFSSVNTICPNKSSSSRSSPDQSSKNIGNVTSPTIEVYQTDISVQQITVNTTSKNENDGLTKEQKREVFLSKDPFDVFEPDCELLNVLKDIPETYASQIIELLKKQHLEQKERLERYDSVNTSPAKHCPTFDRTTGEDFYEKEKERKLDPHNISNCSNSKLFPYPNVINSPNTNDNLIDFTSKSSEFLMTPSTEACTSNKMVKNDKLRRSSTFSMSPSQSLYYSLTDSDTLTTPNTPSVKLIDLESNDGDEISGRGGFQEKDEYWEGILVNENAKNLNASKELFPKIDPVTMNAFKREWAASVIGAYIKGYLTRRLLRTERVQTLIATIKDVLMCALELHQSDNIDEKDVELHRRLINQLSAALYSFHDIFFELSLPEQMLIIAADRQRKTEKLKRPQSGQSSARTPSNKSLNSSRSNKSLNSSRSSSRHKVITPTPSLTKV